MKLYAEISKTEAQPDGTLKVWGFASTGAADSDGETVTADAMKAALPDYMKWGAVREMHQSKAAGTAIEASVQDDGRTYFGAHVVDGEAVKKVQANVYKGFSIGGKITERDALDKSVIRGIKLIEVSLVDRPANPEAVFTLIKAEDADEGAPDVPAAPVARTPEDDVIELAALLDAKVMTPAAVLALVKASQAAAAVAAKTDALKKGMGHVAQLACVLRDVFWLVRDQLGEAMREGDGSAVPAALKDWLDAGGVILQDMVTEEVGELMAEVAPEAEMPGIFMAARAFEIGARTPELEKIGAALSAASKKHIQAIHDASAALGGCQKAAKGEAHGDLCKALGVETEDGLLPAVDSLTKALAAATDELGKAAKRITELEALPTPGRALLKAVKKEADGDPLLSVAAPVSPTAPDGSLLKGEALALHQIRTLYTSVAR